MAEKPVCHECDKEIEGEIVWFRPFGELRREDSQTYRFIAQASTAPMENGITLHPKCFEFRTGQNWPHGSN